MRVDGDVRPVVQTLQRSGLAAGDLYAVGATVTLPLHETPAAEVVAGIGRLNLPLSALAARRPTLDDVYLRLTGGETENAA
jgi:hypothetical protein